MHHNTYQELKMIYDSNRADNIVIDALNTLMDIDNPSIKHISDGNGKMQYYLCYRQSYEYIIKLKRETYFKMLRLGLVLKGYEIAFIKELRRDNELKYEIKYKLTYDKGYSRTRRR